MKYIGVNEIAEKWNISERSVRNYCTNGRIPGAILDGKTWKIPEDEKIHPFQDGNGRVGRLIMFKECLRNGITPFIIEDDIKEFYYRGLKEWKNEQGYLIDTFFTAQDRFKI